MALESPKTLQVIKLNKYATNIFRNTGPEVNKILYFGEHYT